MTSALRICAKREKKAAEARLEGNHIANILFVGFVWQIGIAKKNFCNPRKSIPRFASNTHDGITIKTGFELDSSLANLMCLGDARIAAVFAALSEFPCSIKSLQLPYKSITVGGSILPPALGPFLAGEGALLRVVRFISPGLKRAISSQQSIHFWPGRFHHRLLSDVYVSDVHSLAGDRFGSHLGFHI
jgi:hypothetical protein